VGGHQQRFTSIEPRSMEGWPPRLLDQESDLAGPRRSDAARCSPRSLVMSFAERSFADLSV
jgi:hypothetical protein